MTTLVGIEINIATLSEKLRLHPDHSANPELFPKSAIKNLD
jgi:hypothetical protein